MQYTTDLTNVYVHLSEDCVRSVFPNFVACYSSLSREQSNSLLQLGIYFWQWNSCFFLNFWKKFWFVLKKSFGCLLRGFYFVFILFYIVFMVFFGGIFLIMVVRLWLPQGIKRAKEQKAHNFGQICWWLCMGFGEGGFRSVIGRDFWHLCGCLVLRCFLEASSIYGTKAYHESRFSLCVFAFLSVSLYLWNL